MADPFIGEIRLFAGNFAPAGWAFCNGQLLAISENEALFQLIGITYGGDGQNTFALPDLRSRVPLHRGPAFTIGHRVGTEQASLTPHQMASHRHDLQASTAQGNEANPAGNVLADGQGARLYIEEDLVGSGGGVPLGSGVVANAGGGEPHENMQPFVTISFIIALFGIFPPRN